jgi:cytochrome c553
MKLKLAGLGACLIVTLFQSSANAEGNAQNGQTKSAVCVACHGVDGNSVNPEWPSLAGQHPQYIKRQLEAFQKGTRQNPLMSPIAASLKPEDIEDLAAYFSSQKIKGGETSPDKVSAAQRLYRGGDTVHHIAACEACHGPEGYGNPPASYPSIRGQHATYVAAQLKAYRKGDRSTDPNQMMRNVAANLSDDQIDALASYVQGLR